LAESEAAEPGAAPSLEEEALSSAEWPFPSDGAATAGEIPGSVSIDTAAPVASTLVTSFDMYSVPSIIRSGAHQPCWVGMKTISILQCRCEL
jgi:hypothetical protein